jgi:putative ABC transport system permease protein
VTRINVNAKSEDLADSVESDITTILLQRHEIAYADDADFSVMSQAEMLEMATEVTGILTIFLGAIAGISLFVGGIGIMNIMLVSVTERTREIGLRKAVGARRSDVLTQFLLESVVLSVLGGIIGVAAGIAVAKVVDLSGLMNAVPTLSSVVLALGAAIAVGIFFGIYPANRAAGLSPIEALRYE